MISKTGAGGMKSPNMHQVPKTSGKAVTKGAGNAKAKGKDARLGALGKLIAARLKKG